MASVDMGEETPIDQIEIYWEAAFATEYDIQVSLDGEEYETVRRVRQRRPDSKRIVTWA